tara:strand:- start:18793 stop:19935 length:1143 start_codon:yes stop_codon:yes gene_type:complete
MSNIRPLIYIGSSLLSHKIALSDYHISDVEEDSHLFYKKKINCNNIPIKGSINVSDKAFIIACDRLNRMLRNTHQNIHTNMINDNVEFRIIGKNEVLSDLPEHSHMKDVLGGYSRKGMRTIDNCRGMRHGTMVFCSEENLIEQGKKSKYSPNIKDIFFHETAHSIMGSGLDLENLDKIHNCWNKSKQQGIWEYSGRKAYAKTNPGEYFAELSMWYFGGHGDFVNKELKLPYPGAGGLFEYDQSGFRLVSEIYGGKSQVALNSNSDTVLEPITNNLLHNLKSNTVNNIKISVQFILQNTNDESLYLISYINSKGEKTWGVVINQITPSFTINSYYGNIWLVEKIDTSISIRHNYEDIDLLQDNLIPIKAFRVSNINAKAYI